MKYFSHLNTATKLIQEYRGREPLHLFLKNFFRQHKKFGSKDRKRITHLCYTFYRAGRVFSDEFSYTEPQAIQQILLAGLFICSDSADELLAIMKPLWNDMIGIALDKKIEVLQKEYPDSLVQLQNIFPRLDELSDGIDMETFSLSHLHQPDLFIRIRPGYKDSIIQRLEKLSIPFKLPGESAVSLPNGIKTDELFEIEKEAVVQDLNSQRVGDFLHDFGVWFGKNSPLVKNSPLDHGDQTSMQTISVWDCCAASGGKSIMAKDILVDIDLVVSDIRASILVNLKKRFQKAGLTRYNATVADLSNPNSVFTNHQSPFDLIIADLPCTGSGTWGRTPEQLYFFEKSSIEKYSELQRKILASIMPHLKETGRLLYVTCSVFKKENEEIIYFLQERFSLKIERMELLKGYDKKADTMFAALLSRS